MLLHSKLAAILQTGCQIQFTHILLIYLLYSRSHETISVFNAVMLSLFHLGCLYLFQDALNPMLSVHHQIIPVHYEL